MNAMTLTPACRQAIWGGRRLSAQLGKQLNSPTTEPHPAIAESWELSCHPGGLSTVASGPYAGQTVQKILAQYPQWVGTKAQPGADFPLLVKLLDAATDLSVQVHPGDVYARTYENSYGKNEMWYVMACEPGSRIYLGFQHPITQEEYRRRIADNTLTDVLNAIPVAVGDCYLIPTGMIHALGGGILVAEVQQSSDITYRVYDYDRREADGNPRQLHIEKALAVTDTALVPQKSENPVEMHSGFYRRTLANWQYFQSDYYNVQERVFLFADTDSFHHLLGLAGAFTLTQGGKALSLPQGQSLLVPAGAGHYTVEGEGAFLLSKL